MNDMKLSAIDAHCTAILAELFANSARCGLEKTVLPSGACILDVGVRSEGSLYAGARMIELCQGGLGRAQIRLADMGGVLLPEVTVETGAPRLAALTLQSAMQFQGGMLSGPIKLHLNRSDEILYDISPDEAQGSLTAVVQCDALPEDAWASALAQRAGCPADRLTLICAPQTSVAGAVQIAGRMNENVIFTMERSLGLDASMVTSVTGFAPICPHCAARAGKKQLLPDDFLHYAAGAFLTVRAPDGLDAGAMTQALAFDSLGMTGVLFSDLLKEAGGDFFKIPNILHINKLAVITVNDLTSGGVWTAGSMHTDILKNELIS